MAVNSAATITADQAPDFSLPGTDGKTYSFADVAGENGTVIAFICNHCPYVLAIVDRMTADAQTLRDAGIGFAAICANDSSTHPADSFDNMAKFARDNVFSFPYLHDETQETARAYDAACTPEFYGFDGAGRLIYHGRLDEGRTEPVPDGIKRELVAAMLDPNGNQGTAAIPAMGCSIKWKT